MPHVLLERELIDLVVEQLLAEVEEMFVEVSRRVDTFHEERGGTSDVVETEFDGEGVDELGRGVGGGLLSSDVFEG